MDPSRRPGSGPGSRLLERATHTAGVLRTHLGLGLVNLLQYRSDFAVSVVNAVITLATQLLGLSVVFGQTADLAGWTRDDLLVLVGVHFLISGLIGLVLLPSMETMMEGIRLGTFDFTLVKPVDAQLLASIQVVRPQSLTDVAVGVGVVAWAMTRLGEDLSAGQVAWFVLALGCGLAIVYSFVLALSTMAFWFVKLDNVLAIFQSVFGQAGRWPVTIFPGWVRVVLTFAVPVAFAVTVPAQALTGRLDLWTGLGAVVLAVAFLAASRWFWRFALRRYTGASA